MSSLQGSLLGERGPKATAPEDRCRLVYITSGCLGLGTLIGYHVLITSSDFLIHRFGKRIMFWIIPVFIIPVLMVMIAMIAYGRFISYRSGLSVGFVTASLSLGLLPLAIALFDRFFSYASVLLCAFMCGIWTSTIQAKSLALAGELGLRYTQVTIAGQALAGLSACLLRAIIKLTFHSDKHTSSEVVYFLTGSVFELICLILLLFSLNSPFSEFRLQSYYARTTKLTLTTLTAALSGTSVFISDIIPERLINGKDSTPDDIQTQRKELNDDENEKEESEHKKEMESDEDRPSKPEHLRTMSFDLIGPEHSKVRYHKGKERGLSFLQRARMSLSVVYVKVNRLCLTLFITNLVTFLVFPGLIVGIKSHFGSVNKHHWMPVILLSLFNGSDFWGRQFLASWTSLRFSPDNIWIYSLIRCALYPLFVVLYAGWLRYDLIAYAAVILMAVSHGHINSLCFMWAADSVLPHEQEANAAILSCSLIFGVAVGSYCALVLSYVY